MQQNQPFVVKKDMLVTEKDIFVNFYGLMRYSLIATLLLATVVLNAQTPLTMEAKSYTNAEDTWYGVNVARTVPTTLIFRNNSITSINRYGYLLSAGDEVPGAYNNNLDGAVISGNVITWNGTPEIGIIPHGIFTGYNINVNVKYNYVNKVPMAIIRKSNGMTDVSGAVAYNIVKDPGIGVVVKGMNGVRIYNNTFYSALTTLQTNRALIDIYENPSVTPAGSATGTKIFNNIFYTKSNIKNISITSACRQGFQCDYNIYYCESGTPTFSVDGSLKTFAEWQALGYDTHSKVINPNFKDFVNFVPAARLDYGTDLGTAWAEGLSVNAKWGTTSPETTMQNGTWQVGAMIYKEVVVTPEPVQIPAYSGAVINDAAPSRIELTFSLALAAIVPATSAFSASVNGSSRGVSTASVSGTKVLLTLSSPVIYGDRVTVAYTKPATNPLQTSAGGQAASFTAQTVTNNRAAPVNTPPLISISSPTKSTAFITPATITIDASASDSDGTVVKVEFYNGTVKLGERTTAPWSFTWKDVIEGTYSITATATDNSNSKTTSAPVTVVVEKAAPYINQVPSVTIAPPINRGIFELPASVTFTANAADIDGSVSKVEFYVGPDLVGECLNFPYTFTFDFDTAGTYEITAKVFDNLSASAISDPISITVNFRRPNPDLIALYPNPNYGTFTVDLTNLPEDVEPYTISLVSLSGMTIQSERSEVAEYNKYYDITDSPGGNYVIMISLRGQVISARQFVKL